MVAARHLAQFGYIPSVFYPKPGNNGFFQVNSRLWLCLTSDLTCGQRLVTQCVKEEVSFVPSVEALTKQLVQTHLIVDAIFGFGFSGEIRSPYNCVIEVWG